MQIHPGSRSCDVIIVGAGLIGCAIARALALEGARVVVLERDRPGSGASGAGAGMLTPQAEGDPRSPLLEFGLASRAGYRQWVEALRRESGIDPDYRDHGLVYAAGSGPRAEEEIEHRLAWQRSRGLAVERLDRARLEEQFPGLAPGIRLALLFPDDHLVDPLGLTRAAAAAARGAGAILLADRPVTAIETRGGRVEGIRSGEERVAADVVILAAGCWTGLLGRGLPGVPETEPVRGQMVALEPVELPGRMVMFMHPTYLVPRSSGRLLIGSTMERAGFDSRPTASGIRGLLDAAAGIFPSLAGATFAGAWSGLRPGSPDGLPTIGWTGTPGLMVATGHLRNGVLLAPLTAACVADLHAGRRPRFDLAPFSPERLSTRAGAVGSRA